MPKAIDKSHLYAEKSAIHWGSERAKLQREIDTLTAKGREAEHWFAAELSKLKERHQ